MLLSLSSVFYYYIPNFNVQVSITSNTVLKKIRWKDLAFWFVVEWGNEGDERNHKSGAIH